MSAEKLTRSESDKMIAGVCGGIATYIGVDPVIVRLLFLLLAFASGIGLFLYMVLWFVMPEENLENSIYLNGEPAPQTNPEDQSTQMRTIGILLLLFGGFFLLQQIGIFNWISVGIFWPVVLIGVGVYLLVLRNRNQE
jgi:LPXTG-motif cell wall-anchored protein